MKINTYLWLTLCISLVLLYEYIALQFDLPCLAAQLALSDISTEPGRVISDWLGWIGTGVMSCCLFYTIRKHLKSLKGVGRISRWLNFHIFAGLLGPVLIVFHSDFKFGGFVALSFWSMVICVVTGLGGKYFYRMLLARRSRFRDAIEACKNSKIKKTKLERKLRKINRLKPAMNYWYTLHVPFAIIMYVIAVLHIVVTYIFDVQYPAS